MKKAIIYIFSGTGNTTYSANKIKSALEKSDIHTDVVDISIPFKLDKQPCDYDIVGVGYPIHAFNCPKIVIDFINRLEKTKSKYTFVFKTSGEPFWMNNASSYLLEKALNKKGLSINQEMHFLMPYNIIFRYKKAIVKQMLTYLDAMTNVFALKVANQEENPPVYHFLTLLTAFIYRIQWFGATFNGRFYRVVKRKCINCDICIKNCPAKNIYRDKRKNKIKFNGNCSMCMRCAMDCPTNAINIGILNWWKVWGAYPFNEIKEDQSIKDNYINKKTFGYFRLFYPFLKKNKALCEKYHMNI